MRNKSIMGYIERILAIGLFIALVIGLISIMPGRITANAATLDADEYITDVSTVHSGDSATSAIERGLKVLYESGDSSMICYKTGGEGSALTDIRLVNGHAGEIDGCSYNNLCNFAGYNLCGTTDGKAGGGIVAICVTDDPLVGDGSHVVRDEEGNAVSIGDGKYLAIVRKGEVGRYISDIAVVRAGSEEAAKKKAADHGYDFFKLIDDEEDVELIAFNRTDKVSRAVKGVYALEKEEGYKLFYSTDETAGLPIIDVELSEVSDILWEGGSFKLSEWAKSTFAAGRSSDALTYILEDPAYLEMTDDSGSYVWSPISLYNDKTSLADDLMIGGQGGDSKLDVVVAREDTAFSGGGEVTLVGVDLSEFLTDKEAEEEEEEEEVTEEETEEPEESEETGEEAEDGEEAGEEQSEDENVEEPAAEEEIQYDEPIEEEVEPSVEEETTTGEEAGDTTGSLLGKGNILIIIGIGALFVILIITAVFIKKRQDK